MPRANWKGHLKLDLLTCPVALYTAASSADRIELNTLNRATGHRVRREWVDEETGRPVEAEDAVRGYALGEGDYVVLEKAELDATVPDSDKTILIERFVALDELDEVYFDRPYYLAPADRPAQEAFAVVRDALAVTGTAAIGRAVLFRRERWLALTARNGGILAATLHYADEVRPAAETFDAIPDLPIADEMLDLARHIIDTKTGRFQPEAVNDRYEQALTELIRAKQAGRPPKLQPAPKPAKVVDLMDALRRSAGLATPPPKGAKGTKGAAEAAPARRPAARAATRKAG